ncbi:hypothetical protein PROVALCAL_01682 [Providencia alcalifaciens DSM 30120]|uniref:Uncharacterized protein n=1 Tax=Providencia alcalifaciens DSM 30120 TaxID=520999 RepID=B6XEA4_9GAMM|nr:hypothetical protein PROVALCAL_01682 [Providencia alcalifaciens DSM 30120]
MSYSERGLFGIIFDSHLLATLFPSLINIKWILRHFTRLRTS